MKVKEIVVVSGKGGTGKTSITAALGQCFSKKVLADCDVDAADLHLLLQISSTQTADFQSGHIAEIQTEICRLCGLCETLCRFDSIHLENGQYEVSASSCEGCKVCVDACPQHAIAWVTNTSGVWYESVSNQGTLFHARLHPGSENSGKLVTHVREKAKTSAIENNVPMILVDGPPGIGCPVIAAITGTSATLVVTEPTPSGLHDLERVLILAKHFRVPALVLINKSDLSQEYCKKINACALLHDAEVIAQIPYSSLFTKAQEQGKSIVEVYPESEEAKTIQEVAEILGEMVGVEVCR